MPHDCSRVKAKRSPVLYEPPADIDVVAGGPELLVEAADLDKVSASESHVAARDMLGLGIGEQDVHGAAGSVRDARGDRVVIGRRQVGAADGDVIGIAKSSDE